MSATTTRSTWHALPTELKLAIVESLDKEDVQSLSRLDQKTYQACVPALFKVPTHSHILWRILTC